MSRRSKALLVCLVAVMLVPVSATAANRFADVPESDIFHEDIAWMADTKVTYGCNPPANDRFCPKEHVTREQMAAFFHRFARNQVVDAGAVGGLSATDLGDRLTGLDDQVGTLDDGLAGLGSDVADLGSQTTGLAEQFGEIESTVGELESTVGELETTVGGLDLAGLETEHNVVVYATVLTDGRYEIVDELSYNPLGDITGSYLNTGRYSLTFEGTPDVLNYQVEPVDHEQFRSCQVVSRSSAEADGDDPAYSTVVVQCWGFRVDPPQMQQEEVDIQVLGIG